jgi:hypothetical protein
MSSNKRTKTNTFDWLLVDSLLALNATTDYISERLVVKDGNIANKTTLNTKRILINRKIKDKFDMTLEEYRKLKTTPLRIQIYQKQIELAKSGNVPMLIWLGKNLLGQTDRLETKQDEVSRITISTIEQDL